MAMLQHLLNTTAIWLLSLLAFDISLKKESYHSYNRVFLLFTFCLGIFLPLYKLQDTSAINHSNIGTPVMHLTNVKQRIIEATPTVLPEERTNWLLISYLVGVGISLMFLVKEIITLLILYKRGRKSKDGVWSIIETGKKHSPFSAFRLVFISSKEDYAPEHLRMILTHEEQHGHALHFFDLTLMQLAKVVFWFHPLVYIYHHRLMLLHEYQADAAIETSTAEYGKFLIEQSLLQAAPALSHSFNRSPIKNRIVMLTHRSSLAAGLKRLVAIPLCITCVFLFTESALSKDVKKEGNKLYYKGNVFELWAPNQAADTVMIEHPVTGAYEMVIARVDSFPIRMNGKEIFRISELSRGETEAFSLSTGKEIKDYFVSKMTPILQKMNDGNFGVSTYLILDENGRIVYYNPPHISTSNWPKDESKTVTEVEKELDKILANTTEKFTPVKRSGQKVIIRLEQLFPGRIVFNVKDHNVTVTE